MYNNYLYLKRHIKELSEKIINSTISEIYTQEKDTLFFALGSNALPYRHLIISTKANAPTIYIKSDHRKAKKNTITFFGDFIPTKIMDILFCDTDRIVKFILENCDMYFYYSGPKTNIILNKDNDIYSFKKFDNSVINEKFNEIKGLTFTNNFETIALTKSYNSRRFKLEHNLRKEETPLISESEINKSLINKVFFEDIAVFWDMGINSVAFQPTGFTNFGNNEYFKSFNNVNESIVYYLTLQSKIGAKNQTKSFLVNHVDKELTKLGEKLNKLKCRIQEGSKESVYRKNANLLLNNIYNFTKIDNETVKVFDFETNDYCTLKIQSNLSIQKNIDFYFDKAGNEKQNYIKSIELFNKTEENYRKYLQLQKKLEATTEYEDLLKIKAELKLNLEKKTDNNNEPNYNFKMYLINDKYKVYVGKDSKNNDLLTTRFAKQNDFWFHVRGTSGSHVILRVENTKEPIPKNIIKNVASITAYHSKAKTAGVVPVVYTLKKYVVKKKGMNVGQVALLKEEIVLVKPEIPSGCEFISGNED